MKPTKGAGPQNPRDDERLLESVRASLRDWRPIQRQGRVVEVLGTVVRAVGIEARIGDLCELHCEGREPQRAEVVGFSDQTAILAPFGELSGLSNSARVIASLRPGLAPVGDSLLGRVLDGFGDPIDGRGDLADAPRARIDASPPNPLTRRPIDAVFETGIRALDAVATCGAGQRIGVFSPAGAGKSTLIGMLARFASADVNVIALIGERGREVGDFLRGALGAQGLARSVVVVATSDRPAVERARAAAVATTIAEAFRRRGLHVMLAMDSITRHARALREIGLAAGEPPLRRGFPPSVFSALPRLLERAGNDAVGSITAFYTVLTDGPAEDDPIAEEVRAILDGHVVLTRELAEAAHFPAVDVAASLSRVMDGVVSPEHLCAARQARRWLARHRELELLIRMGEYQEGEDAQADTAIERMPAIRALLQQRPDAHAAFGDTVRELLALAARADGDSDGA